MRRFVKLGQTGDKSGDPLDTKTTIHYYELERPQSFLAVVRYTAYKADRKVLRVIEGVYGDSPDEYCRLERDVETALKGGIDTLVQSAYEHEVFPVISRFLD